MREDTITEARGQREANPGTIARAVRGMFSPVDEKGNPDRAQVVATLLWVIVAGSMFLPPPYAPARRIGWAFVVLVLWGTLLAELRRGPTKPLLLPRGKSGLGTVVVKMPADYIRLGQPVPRQAMLAWWAGHVLLAALCVGFTIALLMMWRG